MKESAIVVDLGRRRYTHALNCGPFPAASGGVFCYPVRVSGVVCHIAQAHNFPKLFPYLSEGFAHLHDPISKYFKFKCTFCSGISHPFDARTVIGLLGF